MKQAIALAMIVVACSNLPADGDGVVALEVRSPLAITMKAGESVTLQAQALDRSGAPVAAAILWSTADTTITLDATSGIVTALQGTGSARVQAAVGNLRSELIVITLQPAAAGGIRSN